MIKTLGSGLWILDFALEGWKGGGSFAGKPRWEDASVEAMKGAEVGQFRDRDRDRGGAIWRSTWDGNIAVED